jgi:hypothetical protein
MSSNTKVDPDHKMNDGGEINEGKMSVNVDKKQ